MGHGDVRCAPGMTLMDRVLLRGWKLPVRLKGRVGEKGAGGRGRFLLQLWCDSGQCRGCSHPSPLLLEPGSRSSHPEADLGHQDERYQSPALLKMLLRGMYFSSSIWALIHHLNPHHRKLWNLYFILFFDVLGLPLWCKEARGGIRASAAGLAQPQHCRLQAMSVTYTTAPSKAGTLTH